MDNAALKKKFNHFIGQEVSVENKKVATRSGPISQIFVRADDPVIEAFSEAAFKESLYLCIWTPGKKNDMSVRRKRLNVDVKIDDNGVWRIADTLRIG